MKTVLISGDPVPAALREIVRRGSTSLIERRPAELGDAAALEADRIVFWSAGHHADIRTLAEKLARADDAERRETLVFVAPEQDGDPAPAVLPPHESFLWPRDEDRLKMVFLTGA